MALSTLYNVPMSDDEFNVFSFSNQDEHNKIAMVIASRYNIQVPSYVLDPIPVADPDAFYVWAEQHQVLHNIMDSIAGVTSNDLTDVDLSDEAQRTEWIWLHAQEHYQVANFLELQ